MPTRTDALILSSLPLQAFGVYGAFVPNMYSLRQSEASPAVVADVRTGYRIATGITLGLATVASAAMDSIAPAIVGIIIAGAMIFFIESSLASPSAVVRAEGSAIVREEE